MSALPLCLCALIGFMGMLFLAESCVVLSSAGWISGVAKAAKDDVIGCTVILEHEAGGVSHRSGVDGGNAEDPLAYVHECQTR